MNDYFKILKVHFLGDFVQLLLSREKSYRFKFIQSTVVVNQEKC